MMKADNTGVCAALNERIMPAVPNHTVLRLIGSGSYGDIWLARSEALGRFRAVKVIHRSRFENNEPFDREFSGIERYEPVSRNHPGLVHILDVGIDRKSGYFYYIMELADDQNAERRFDPDEYAPKTLHSERRRLGRLPLDECRKIALNLSSALAYLHGCGLVHRDIKPHNIIFVDGEAKLADIGLVSATTDARTFVGTEGYIPMEGSGSAQADVYALGKVIYEISTGKDRLLCPELPDDIDAIPDRKRWLQFNAIVLRACAEKQVLRYASASCFHEDIEREARGQKPRRNWHAWNPGLPVRISLLMVSFLLALGSFLWVRKLAVSADAGIDLLWSTPYGYRSAFVGDVLGNGKLHLVVGDGTGAALFSSDGQQLYSLPNIGDVRYAGDLDGDGKADIFAGHRTSEGHAAITAFSKDGNPIMTFAVRGAKDTSLVPFLLEDTNGDGRLELLATMVSGFSCGPRGVVIFDATTGQEIGRTETGPVVNHPPWVGPVFGVPGSRIIFGSVGVGNGRRGPDGSDDYSSYIWCLDAKGNPLWRSGPFHTGGFQNCDVAVPPGRQDHKRFLAVSLREHGMGEFGGRSGVVALLHVRDGSALQGARRDFGEPVRVIAITEADKDGNQALVVLQESRHDRRYLLRTLDFSPGLTDLQMFNAGEVMPDHIQIADLNRNGQAEVIYAAGHELHVLSGELRPLLAWQRPDGAREPIRRVLVADVTGDGKSEIIVASGDSRTTQRVDVLSPKLP